MDKIAGAKPKDTFFPITSVPCFEYWLLLHFTYTTAQFTSVGGISAGTAVLELKKRWPEYEKAKKGVFVACYSKLDYAIANAKRALAESQKSHTDNPSTHIHELVTYLRNIRPQK